MLKILVLFWPDSVNELLVKYVKKNKINPSRVEIVNADEIVIHNEESK